MAAHRHASILRSACSVVTSHVGLSHPKFWKRLRLESNLSFLPSFSRLYDSRHGRTCLPSRYYTSLIVFQPNFVQGLHNLLLQSTASDTVQLKAACIDRDFFATVSADGLA